MALTVALHLRLCSVLAEVFGNIGLVQLVQAHNAQLHRALKHEAQRNYYGYTLFHYRKASCGRCEYQKRNLNSHPEARRIYPVWQILRCRSV